MISLIYPINTNQYYMQMRQPWVSGGKLTWACPVTELSKLSEWAISNRLSISVGKTFFNRTPSFRPTCFYPKFFVQSISSNPIRLDYDWTKTGWTKNGSAKLSISSQVAKECGHAEYPARKPFLFLNVSRIYLFYPELYPQLCNLDKVLFSLIVLSAELIICAIWKWIL